MTMMMGGKVHRTRSKARRSAGGVPGAFLARGGRHAYPVDAGRLQAR